ncbi:MAG: ADP-ribosylglycohydrolase family protein [Erysipelotrichaceae bacterium]|nr:ADP-ribosylglycohydrolase family protein [Erysipelotrichaceae bacterium]
MTYQEYLYKTYAAWLGKIIGIRLGAPVEGWSAEEIKRTYGKIHGYIVDYDVFASDDDSNGPLFFVRALEKCCSKDITAQEMGDNVLNWLCDGHGFFWWGGEGIATEHTAYSNLKKGICAPSSGSCEVNGKDLAEQIGGQIFSDCWGYVAPNDPKLACNLASKMSSVTHDGDGIEGGKFVAVAIALAYELKDIRKIIDTALTYLDPTSSYVKLCQDVITKIDEHPNDSDYVLQWIQENHGYDKYPGVCHILPNTAIMIWAMLYGHNDFDTTMNMLCEAGWDTDCTLGNVGSIMGAMVGLEGIDEKWTRPINDVLLSSSCMGSENIDTVSSSVRVFTELGWRLQGKDVPEKYLRDRSRVDFLLPRSTGGMRINKHRYFEANAVNCDETLKIVVNNAYPDTVGKVYLTTYYKPEDVYDARYEPSFSPIVYPGEKIHYTVSNPEHLPATFCIYMKDDQGNMYRGERQEISEKTTLSLSLPTGDYVVCECGVEAYVSERVMRTYFVIHEFYKDNTAAYGIDFSNLSMEDWGYDFGGVRRSAVRGCVTHHGSAYTDQSGLHLDGMISFGDMFSQVQEISLEYDKAYEDSVSIVFDMCGYMDYKAICVHEDVIEFVTKRNGVSKSEKRVFENTNMPKITLKIDRLRDRIMVYLGEVEFSFDSCGLSASKGAVGLICEDPKDCVILGCKLGCSNFQ